jgi:Bacterial aa3 type cytochrome c oxidase subunit IV
MASGNDIKAAESTYGGFLTMLKWGSIVTALVTVLVIALISG